ncbi:MAG: two-component sensor histidine kinase [Methylobacter sp.]|nr:MAG: two-component sensor histidine kinase [Methylobacter sp.]PPD22688.1 MAG: two-component sensor histidine kinase [Methylobacter sp.]
MTFKSLYSRIALTFALLMLVFGGLYESIQMFAAIYNQQEISQRLNRGLAAHIAGHWPLLADDHEVDSESVNELFHMLMMTNPGIEVYLLDAEGVILAHEAPPGAMQLNKVSLAPIQAFLAGAALPLAGDNPANPANPSVFSVAELEIRGETAGYLYIIVTGNNYRQLADQIWQGHAFQLAAWASVWALLILLSTGLGLFSILTRRLNALTCTVAAFDKMGFDGALHVCPKISASRDEIGMLAQAFEIMAGRISDQMSQLQRQSDLRSDMIANVSHDIRTPLASMQGYLETLLRISDTLSIEEQQRYLHAAVRQSRHVALLSQQLFELAKLECEEETPNCEAFNIQELAQDLMQKFELTASQRGITLRTVFDSSLPMAWADIGMIERVLTNLIDNALRYTPQGGEIVLELAQNRSRIHVRVSDTGTGIAEEHLAGLFDRASPLRKYSRKHGGGGLGLLITKTILQLHGSTISVVNEDTGATFTFALPAAGPA